jgi:hypothetical protein
LMGSLSIFAARMKSLSDNPPIACVESSIHTLRRISQLTKVAVYHFVSFDRS